MTTCRPCRSAPHALGTDMVLTVPKTTIVNGAPDSRADSGGTGVLELDAIRTEPLDPLFKDCPDLPCRVHDSDLWFAEAPTDLERAKAFCRDCPARAACLSAALQRREPWGVWGGEIFERGAVIARKRPRGRPHKADTATAA